MGIWDKHASPPGLACLGVSLVAAALYQQAPKRQAPAEADEELCPVNIEVGQKTSLLSKEGGRSTG